MVYAEIMDEHSTICKEKAVLTKKIRNIKATMDKMNNSFKFIKKSYKTKLHVEEYRYFFQYFFFYVKNINFFF